MWWRLVRRRCRMWWRRTVLVKEGTLSCNSEGGGGFVDLYFNMVKLRALSSAVPPCHGLGFLYF